MVINIVSNATKGSDINVNITKIPPSEFEVMKIIWNSDEAVSARDALEALEMINGWKRTTVLTLLSRLVQKGFLGAEKIKRYTYYTAMVNKDEYLRFETELFFKNIHDSSLKSLITTLNSCNILCKEDTENIKNLIS